MKKKVYDTIIVGGGVAGLGCARELHKKRHSFLMITKDIGGRIQASPDWSINYGAYYVRKDYGGILDFVKRGRRIACMDFRLHRGERSYTLVRALYPKYFFKSVRIFIELLRFKKHYLSFTRKCKIMKVSDVLEEDAYLNRLYTMSAHDFIEEKGAQKVMELFWGEGVYSTCFAGPRDITAFIYLQLLLPLVIPTHQFVFQEDRATKGWSQNIREDEVVRVERKGGVNYVETVAGKIYGSRNLIFATPYHVSKKLLSLKQKRTVIDVHVMHVRGELRKKWEDVQWAEVFNSPSGVYGYTTELDDTHLLFHREGKKVLDAFFKKGYRLIEHVHWNPAFVVNWENPLDPDQGNGIYVIGDHSTYTLKDAYISGVYAANQILKK